MIAIKIEEKFHSLAKAFLFFDIDGDQLINRVEFHKGIEGLRVKLSKGDIDSVFEYMDRDKDGNIDFLSTDCWLRPVALDSDGNWDFIEVAPTKTIPDNFAIVDAFSRPIRFFYKDGGNKNTGKEGFDIWSAGRDGETLDDSGATPSSTNGMKDDVKNW